MTHRDVRFHESNKTEQRRGEDDDHDDVKLGRGTLFSVPPRTHPSLHFA
jgi:hypothetical protein